MPKSIGALLMKHRGGLCRDCLIVLTATSPAEADAALTDLARNVRIAGDVGCCAGCRQTTTVIRFAVADDCR